MSTSAVHKIADDIISKCQNSSDDGRQNAISVDVSKMFELVDAVISTYRFVN